MTHYRLNKYFTKNIFYMLKKTKPMISTTSHFNAPHWRGSNNTIKSKLFRSFKKHSHRETIPKDKFKNSSNILQNNRFECTPNDTRRRRKKVPRKTYNVNTRVNTRGFHVSENQKPLSSISGKCKQILWSLFDKYIKPMMKTDTNMVMEQIEKVCWEFGDNVSSDYRVNLYDMSLYFLSELGWKENQIRNRIVTYRNLSSTIHRCGGLMFNSNKTKILLIKPPNGGWTLPVGKREMSDETDVITAKREVKEETGYNKDPSDDYIIVYRKGKKSTPITCFVYWDVPEDFDFTPMSPYEVAEVKFHDIEGINETLKYIKTYDGISIHDLILKIKYSKKTKSPSMVKVKTMNIKGFDMKSPLIDDIRNIVENSKHIEYTNEWLSSKYHSEKEIYLIYALSRWVFCNSDGYNTNIENRISILKELSTMNEKFHWFQNKRNIFRNYDKYKKSYSTPIITLSLSTTKPGALNMCYTENNETRIKTIHIDHINIKDKDIKNILTKKINSTYTIV